MSDFADNKHLFDGKATNKDRFEKIAEQFTNVLLSNPRCIFENTPILNQGKINGGAKFSEIKAL